MKEIIEVSKKISYGILAWGAAIAIVAVSGISITKINMLVPIIMVSFLFVIAYFRKHCNTRDIRYGFGFSVPFALSLVLGSNIDMESIEKTFEWNIPLNLLYFTLLTGMGMIVIASFLVFLGKLNIRWRQFMGSPRRWGGITVALCIIAWLPYYFTYFPGIISNDAISMIGQGMGFEALNNHHPVLFTLFMKCVLMISTQFTTLNGAVGLFCTVHMIVFALVLGYVVQWLARKGASRELVVLTILYFACNPAIALYSVYITKDIFFSSALLLFVLYIHDVVQSKGAELRNRGRFLPFILICLAVIFLRNNGIYIVVGTLILLMLVYQTEWKRLGVTLGISLIVALMVNGPIYTALNIAPSSFAESMSIPLQQVGQVIVEEGDMGEWEEEYLSNLLPFDQVKEVYTPGYTDPYKFHEDFNNEYLNETKGEFLQVWASLLPSHFATYVEAYLMQTAGYWHIGQTTSLSTYGVDANTLGLEQVNGIEQITGISLEPIIEKLILAVRKAPVLCLVTNMAGMMFLFLFTVIYAGYNKQLTRVISQVPIWILWATVLVATPAYCLYRYLFVLSIALPYMIYLLQLLSSKGKEINGK
ncbi:MAG: DUF6020 family protein [Eubacteriales bacterium]